MTTFAKNINKNHFDSCRQWFEFTEDLSHGLNQETKVELCVERTIVPISDR